MDARTERRLRRDQKKAEIEQKIKEDNQLYYALLIFSIIISAILLIYLLKAAKQDLPFLVRKTRLLFSQLHLLPKNIVYIKEQFHYFGQNLIHYILQSGWLPKYLRY